MFEKRYKQQQLITILNQYFIFFYLVYEYLYGNEIETAETMQLIVIMVIIIEAIHIGKINLKCNSMMMQFQHLLFLISWYFLLSLDQSIFVENTLKLMMPITFYFLIRFIVNFIFQNTAYKFKKITDIILLLNFVVNLAAIILDYKLFNLLFLYQVVVGLIVVFLLFLVHYRRIIFVLKFGWVNVRYSLLLSSSIFIIYIYVFNDELEYIDNLGSYFLIFTVLLIVHCITFNHKNSMITTVYRILFNNKNKYILLGTFFCTAGLVIITLVKTIVAFFILMNIFLLCYTVINYILINSLEEDLLNNQKLMERYQISIKQIKREELLKRDFSNFLHDNILQDILALNNLVNKAENAKVKVIISQALENLNHLIREQMHSYHPQILKSLTLKENLENLVCSLSELFSVQLDGLSFECDDRFFLVDPYDVILYRIFKELLMNAFKHSQCTKLNIQIIQSNEKVTLVVQDNGVGMTDMKLDQKLHRGLKSIKEQLDFIDGRMEIEAVDKAGTGTKILIEFVMKGEASYAHFIDR